VSESLLKRIGVAGYNNPSVHLVILLSLTLWWLSLAIRSRLFDSVRLVSVDLLNVKASLNLVERDVNHSRHVIERT
jgi:hypothetical protein